jgi:hypothetical protein
MRTIAISLMMMGGVLLLAGAVLWLAARLNLPLGRLPGDLHWSGKGWSVHFPLVTMLILSLLLTLILNLFMRR